MKETLAYDLIKTLFEHKPELLASHSDVKYFALESQERRVTHPVSPGRYSLFEGKGNQSSVAPDFARGSR
jgi:TRAP-type uncharacterized transport system substrate-binding protein